MPGLYQGSCEKMKELQDNSIDLIVTSPPYWVDLQDHYFEQAFARTKTGESVEDYQSYLHWLKRCLTECYRVLKPGRICVIQVATTIINKTMYATPYHISNILEEIGFIFHQDIIWHRWRGWDRRGGVMIQHPFPGYYAPNRVLEYVLVFRKPGGQRLFEGRSQQEKEANRIPVDDLLTKEINHNLWHIAPVQPHSLPHPCPFPDELAYRLITLYSYKGERVLDPFTGSGTTLKVAKLTGRDYYGYEVQPVFLKLARQRLKETTLQRQGWICRFQKVPPALPV